MGLGLGLGLGLAGTTRTCFHSSKTFLALLHRPIEPEVTISSVSTADLARTNCSVFRQARTSFCARVASCASVFASARRPSRWHTCSGLRLELGSGLG